MTCAGILFPSPSPPYFAFFLILPPTPTFHSAMEDRNMLVADCIVICCCSQCLILQIIIFVLLKLPSKLIRKTKAYAKKKLIRRGRMEERITDQKVKGRFLDEAVELHRSSISIEILEDFNFAGTGEGLGFQCCIEQAEKVLEELSQKGEFAFGSFWGRSAETSGMSSSSSSSCSLSSYLANHKFDDISVVKYEEYLIEMTSFSCSS